MKSSGIGGQAVIEGIMMRNGTKYAVAVRKENNEIALKKDEFFGTNSSKITKLPFFRGIFSFIDSLMLGSKCLNFSASFFEEDEKESKTEKVLRQIFGDKLEKVLVTFSTIFGVIMAIGIFMLLPAVISNFLKGFISSMFVLSLIEGVIRIGIFVGYVALISRMEEIKRVFMYHGAEHKCINCIEHGLELTVENVMISSKQHKRCGTSFMLIVMVISILFFMVIRVDTLWLRLLSRVLLIPVIAGVSYECLKIAGNSNSKWIDLLSKPGMWLQNLTTKEPTKDMVEVAIFAAVANIFVASISSDMGGSDGAILTLESLGSRL